MLIIDSREPSEIISSLASVPSKVDRLSTGDYRLADTVIERKTLSDFFSSLRQKRLLLQMQRMNLSAEKRYLIIEGFFDFSYVNDVHFLYRMLNRITVELGITIIFSENPRNTAEIIRRLYFLNQGARRRISVRDEERIMGMLLLLGISKNKLNLILAQYDNLSQIFTVDADSLMRIQGIGKKTAEKISEAMNLKSWYK